MIVRKDENTKLMDAFIPLEGSITWIIAIDVQAIELLRRDKEVHFCHVHREGNKLADYFT